MDFTFPNDFSNPTIFTEWYIISKIAWPVIDLEKQRISVLQVAESEAHTASILLIGMQNLCL
jgi:hypothetical protein